MKSRVHDFGIGLFLVTLSLGVGALLYFTNLPDYIWDELLISIIGFAAVLLLAGLWLTCTAMFSPRTPNDLTDVNDL